VGALVVSGPCPFCQRIGADDYDDRSGGIVTFEPLNPVALGHRLFMPSVHLEWHHPGAAGEMGACLRAAVRYAESADVATTAPMEYNLIASNGASATQTIAHIHLHLVPRTMGDGLKLPWTGQPR
jgi:histidine triad (HIT) family protein